MLVRMINNLLMFKKNISEFTIEDMYFQNLVRVYKNIKGENTGLIQEFCEMLTHIVEFMEDYNSFLHHLIHKELIDIFIEACDLLTNQELLAHMICCFSIILRVDRDNVTMKVRENARTFERMADDGEETVT